MDLTLQRTELEPDGIFSELRDERGNLVATTVEHSYECTPKLPPGVYVCKRGMHRLEGMTEPFETFEITGVVGHTNILFHVGNTQDDSHGCVCLGSERIGKMVAQSRVTFVKFMELQAGLDSFSLTVIA